MAQLTVLDGYDPAISVDEAEVAIREVTLPADEAEVMFTADVTLPLAKQMLCYLQMVLTWSGMPNGVS